jgi:hypothetical protein
MHFVADTSAWDHVVPESFPPYADPKNVMLGMKKL